MPTVTSHPFYIKTTSNLERTVIRDKLGRLVQYFSRFLSWYAAQKGLSPLVVERLKSLTKNISLARKLFRVGKPLNNIKALAGLLSSRSSIPLLWIAGIGKNVGTGAFLTLDSLAWLNSTGAYKFRPRTAARLTTLQNRFWAISLVSALIEASFKAYRADAQLRALSRESEKDTPAILKASELRKTEIVHAVWQVLDLSIPLTALGISGLNDGAVGLAGAITAYLGLRELW